MMKTESFKVLLADDDVTARFLMQAALEKVGFNVFLACDGEEAIRLFDENPTDMVMLDVEMPFKDGYEVCSYLRKKVGNELPIVMVTGMDDTQSIDRAFEVGATAFITKPINWGLVHYRLLSLKRTYLNLIELKVANARNKAILSAIPDTIFILNDDGKVIDTSNAFDQSGYTSWFKSNQGEALNQSLPEEIVKVYLDAINRSRKNGTTEHFEYQLRNAEQESRHYECRIVVIDSHEALCLVRDITERKDSENKIFRLAYFDDLTGLPNRQSFMERLKREIKRAKLTSTRLAILFLDLDGFKGINDTIGHNTGDVILQWAAERIKNSIRSSDFVSRSHALERDIELARLGSDEFTVAIPNLPCVDDALLLAHRIRETMQHPFQLETRDVVITASVGIALYPDDGEDVETLIKHADTAMSHAKSEGRDNCQFYSKALTNQAEKRLNLENDLRNAMLQNELHFQRSLWEFASLPETIGIK